MNDAPTMTPSAEPPGAGVPAPPAPPVPREAPAAARAPSARPGGAAGPVAVLAFVLAAVALAVGLVDLRHHIELRQQLDQQLAADHAREQADGEREHRLAELERQWNQAQADGDLATGVLSDADMHRRREQLALLDIERVLEQVQLQLRLGAAPAAALEALGAVDARLARLAGPTALRVQTALHHDLARLKAAPDIDRGMLVVRLDPLLSAVDHWHASADPLHPAARPAPAAAPAVAAPAASAPQSTGARLRAWIASELGDFLRIREVETPDAILLGPAQQQLLRDRFRLGVLDLRQAILARDERAVHAQAGALDALLEHYFDPNQAEVAAAQALLHATEAAAVPAPAGSLDETLAALRAGRAVADR